MLFRHTFRSSALLGMFLVTTKTLADPVVDDFERTSLGANWRAISATPSTNIVFSSDLGLRDDSVVFGNVSWSRTSLSANQFCEAVISPDKNGGMLNQVYVRRRTSDGARYGFHYAGDPRQTAVFGNWEIKYDGSDTGITSSLATAPTVPAQTAPVPGDTLRVEVSGSTIKGFHNGVEVISATVTNPDFQITDGEPGLAYRWAIPGTTPTVYPAPVWESWLGGSLIAPTPTVADITVLDTSGTANDLQISFNGNVFAERSVQVRNDGSATLMIQQVAVDDPLAAPFSIEEDNCTAATLNPNTSCSFKVRIDPPATGTFSDTFSITSDDPDEGLVIVSVQNNTAAPGGDGGGSTNLWTLALLFFSGLIRRYSTRFIS